MKRVIQGLIQCESLRFRVVGILAVCNAIHQLIQNIEILTHTLLRCGLEVNTEQPLGCPVFAGQPGYIREAIRFKIQPANLWSEGSEPNV